MKYCNYCGKQIEDDQVCDCLETQPTEAKKQLLIKKGLIFGGIVLTAIISIVLIIVFVGNKAQDTPNLPQSPGSQSNSGNLTTIDPFDYIEVTFEGVNGHGEIYINDDSDALIKQLIGEEPSIEDEETLKAWFAQYIMYDYTIEFSPSIETGLSNGDTVNITCIVPDEAKERLERSSKQYTVTGLKTPQTKDIFADIEICYDGISGKANATVNKIHDTDILNDCDFEITPNYNLSNGDTITVTLMDYSIEMLSERYNVVPQTISQTYTVRGLSEYVSSIDQLPQDVIKQFAQQLVEDEQQSEDSMFSYSETKIYGVYYMSRKPDKTVGYRNILKFVVFYDQYLRGEYWRTVYIPLDFYNITTKPDGELDIVYEDGKGGSFNTDIDAHLFSYEADYEIFEFQLSL